MFNQRDIDDLLQVRCEIAELVRSGVLCIECKCPARLRVLCNHSCCIRCFLRTILTGCHICQYGIRERIWYWFKQLEEGCDTVTIVGIGLLFILIIPFLV